MLHVIALSLLRVGSSKFLYLFNHWPPCWGSQYEWRGHKQDCMLFTSFTQQMLYPGNNNTSQQGWQFKPTNTNGDPSAFIHSIADCLRSYLITFSLPIHLAAMKNWNHEEKLIVSIRFWPHSKNPLGVWARRLKILFPLAPYPNSWLVPTLDSGPGLKFTLSEKHYSLLT